MRVPLQAVTQKAECADVVIAVVGSSAINGREGPTGSGTVTPVSVHVSLMSCHGMCHVMWGGVIVTCVRHLGSV
jgi:hypothetical protein